MNYRACLALSVWLLSVACSSAEEKTKILLIGKDRDHAYATHTYMDDCELLARCLRQTPGVETIVSNGWPKDQETLKDVRAIVLDTKLGGTMLFGGPHRRQVEEMLKKGVGLTAIHWSTGAEKPEGEQYLHTLGGWFNTDFSEYHVWRSKVSQPDPKHPICRGWHDFDLKEEYYIKLRFLPESKPIMTAKVQDKNKKISDYDIGWTYERPDGGRSFGFVGGHFHDNFGIKPFRQAVVNGIVWTARLEVPEDGAPCAITAKDMELAPDPVKKK
jgi:type 1 glutamine amidotransferase